MARLTPDQARRYEREFSRAAFHARMRQAQLAGHDIGDLIDRVTADSLDGARSISSVLHSRLAGLGLDAQHDATWSQRTPADAGQMARELADGLDDRTSELGQRHVAHVQPWLGRRLGVLAPDASPALRAEYERRAGIAAGYREAAGITDPDRDISPEPHEGNPELETWRKAAMQALEIRDEAGYLRGLSRAQLEATVAEGERAMAAAPPDVSAQLRAAAQAKADAWAQHADAQARQADAEARGAENLATMHAETEAALEPRMAAYERWSAATAAKRDAAGKARAELGRREAETPNLVDWWRTFEADVEAVDRAIGRRRQAAAEADEPWPPRPGPQSAAKPDATNEVPWPDAEPPEAAEQAGLNEVIRLVPEPVTDRRVPPRRPADAPDGSHPHFEHGPHASQNHQLTMRRASRGAAVLHQPGDLMPVEVVRVDLGQRSEDAASPTGRPRSARRSAAAGPAAERPVGGSPPDGPTRRWPPPAGSENGCPASDRRC